MNPIIVLDQNTANQIAAGEVVERPSSIVKEMIENSIDAGADKISIELSKGGISKIKISDNGCGIPKEDSYLAFERHATSKITCIDDLNTINTMGFRGEALASIAAVSKVELISKTADDEIGYRLVIEGGEVISMEDFQCNIGTTFIVKDLFYNTPARYKFLKKDSSEASFVSDIVSRLALTYPNVAFSLKGATSNNNYSIRTNGNGDLHTIIYNLYGRDIANNSFKVEYAQDDIKISGFVGNNTVAKATRTWQTAIVNNRYVKSQIVSKAVSEGMATWIMKGKFPFFVLNISIPNSMVDFNVHPAKTEVRFSSEQNIFHHVYYAVLNSVTSHIDEQKQKASEKPVIEFRKAPHVSFDVKSKSEPVGIEADVKSEDSSLSILDLLFNANKDKDIETPTMVCEHSTDGYDISNNQSNSKQINSDNHLADSEFKQIELVDTNTKDDTVTIFDISNAKYVGQVFKTFLLFELDDVLYAIDQHAAHERINYETIKAQFESSEILTQQLLVPVTFDLSIAEAEAVNNNLEYFNKLGFEAEMFGERTVIIRGCPITVETTKVSLAFTEILSKIIDNNAVNEIVNEYAIYTIACKASIKANQSLSGEEANALLRELLNANSPLTCPHGRPTITMMKKSQFERLFKRIV